MWIARFLYSLTTKTEICLADHIDFKISNKRGEAAEQRKHKLQGEQVCGPFPAVHSHLAMWVTEERLKAAMTSLSAAKHTE